MTLRDVLSNFTSFLIVSHQGLDGDAVGSSLGMGHLISSLGKDVSIIFPEPLPQKYLPLAGELSVLSEFPSQLSDSALLFLDCADPERGLKVEISRFLFVANIDHHISNTNFGTWNVVKPEYSSTGEVLAEILFNEGIEAPERVWDCLYLAIFSDTNGFRFSNTRPQTLEIAGKVLSRGSGPEVSSIFFSLSQLDLKVLGVVFTNMVYDPPIAFSYLPLSLGLPEGFDSDFIMNIWKNWPEPQVYLLFKEISPNSFKVSMRGRGDIDLSKIAGKFQGGGHPSASGCRVKGNLQEVEKILREAILDEIRRD
ncbi:MAG: DHH family phosphoesterase [Caldiserica bacterium]|jgi:phosphoesterase RecJ-like protein|nr:DHH family phosphoesterase [Caldisericota bacterium]MDH7562783.1 DHH family phosphoesterase [Caldisericota bacterium]